MELGEDIEIVFTGMRPGEKLFEELLTAEEGTNTTSHEKIFIARGKHILSKEEINKSIDELKDNLKDEEKLIEIIKTLVPSGNFSRTS